MKCLAFDYIDTASERVYVVVNSQGVCKVAVGEEDWFRYKEKQVDLIPSRAGCQKPIEQLTEYFAGGRKHFDLKFSLCGTPFFERVWSEVLKIPYGVVRTYSDIAVSIEKPLAVRAVGLANYSNPLPILIPCHRVVGKDGKMVGYKGNKTTFKKHLLELEQMSLNKGESRNEC